MRSDNVKKGPERTPNRSLFYALGYTDEELERPLIGVVSAYSEIVPGHMHLDKVAQAAKDGVRLAGGTPVLVPAIGVCDGIAMGHKGMKYSLPSRELICDSIETMAQAHCFDGLVLVPNCDKIVPAMLMAAARLNIPSIVVSGGPMLAGRQGKRKVSLSQMFEAVGGFKAGLIDQETLDDYTQHTCPGCGSCAGMYTANSMNCLSEAIGMALPGNGTIPAVYAARLQLAKHAGMQVMELLRRGITPLQILTREALLNGVAGAMATGSSTNLVLHLLAIAHEAGVELTLDDFDRISREVPFVCNLQPSGKYPIVSMDACGGIPAVLKNVEPKLHRDVMTVAGKTLGQMLDAVEPVENDVIRTMEHPQKPEGGIAVLCGSLAPDGAVVKQSGVKPSMYRFSGRARVFNSMEEADAAVSAGTIEKGTVLVIRYEGPKGGPGMREMLSTTALIMGRGMDEDCALVTDGRFSGATHGPCIGHISPEAAAGGPIALVEDGDEIFIDIAARRLELKVSPEELERRRAVWKPLVKPRGPALAKYAAHVSSADRGAIIELENSACQ